MFRDLLEGNERHLSTSPAPVPALPARHLAIVTCMDARVDPLTILGLDVGDAMTLRNAGARLTDEVLDGLALVVAKLGVTRVAVLQHTDCKAGATVDDLRSDVVMARGIEALGDTEIGAFVVDVTTNKVTAVDV